MTSCRNCICALFLAVFNCGCASFWYELQPHRLKKLNSGPAPSLSPDFTNRTSTHPPTLVRRDRSVKAAVMTANRAEISLATGQIRE